MVAARARGRWAPATTRDRGRDPGPWGCLRDASGRRRGRPGPAPAVPAPRVPARARGAPAPARALGAAPVRPGRANNGSARGPRGPLRGRARGPCGPADTSTGAGGSAAPTPYGIADAGPAGVPSASSGPEAAAVLVVLRIREVPVDSRRGRVSLAMGFHSPVQTETVISSSPRKMTEPRARSTRQASFQPSMSEAMEFRESPGYGRGESSREHGIATTVRCDGVDHLEAIQKGTNGASRPGPTRGDYDIPPTGV